MIQRKNKTPRQSKARSPLPKQDIPASVYQHMHMFNDGIERAVLSITELVDDEVFEKTDMIYRALQLRELQALLSGMMSQGQPITSTSRPNCSARGFIQE